MGIFGKVFGGIKKGVSALGGLASKAAPALSLIPGVGTLGAAGLGSLGSLLSGGSFGDILKSGLKGATGGLLQKGLGALGGLGGLGGGGGGGGVAGAVNPDGSPITAFGGGGGDGGGGIMDFLGKLFGGGKKALEFVGGEGGARGGLERIGGLLAGGAQLKGARDQRKSAEGFEQGRLDILKEHLKKTESQFDARAPAREQGLASLLEAAKKQGAFKDRFSTFLDDSATRKPGEFAQRGA